MMCRFCNEFEAWLDGWCANCMFFGPGDPHGKRYSARLRKEAREREDRAKQPLPSVLDRFRLAVRRKASQ